LDDAFREEESGGEFPVMAGGAHDDGQGASFHPESQGRLGSDGIWNVLTAEDSICSEGGPAHGERNDGWMGSVRGNYHLVHGSHG
jgi:hypothetical protein